MSCRTETETVSRMAKLDHRLLLQPSASGVAVSLLVLGFMNGHIEHSLWCFHGSMC